jgi:hypothetical protein
MLAGLFQVPLRFLRSSAQLPIRPRCLLLRRTSCQATPASNLRHPEFAAVDATQQGRNIQVGIKVRPVQTSPAPNNFNSGKLFLRSRLQSLKVFARQHAAPPVGQFQDEQIKSWSGPVFNLFHKGSLAQTPGTLDGAVDFRVWGQYFVRHFISCELLFRHEPPPIMQLVLQNSPSQL